MKPETSLSQVMNGGEDDATDSEMEVQESLPGVPENNVHLIHSISKQIVGLGLHITEHAHGCNAFRVIEGGLVAKSELQHGDQIQRINGRDLKDLRVEQIADIFEDLDTTETITLRVVRQYENDDGCQSQCETDITITNDSTSTGIDGIDEIDYSQSTGLMYQSTLRKKIIYEPNNASPIYVMVDGESDRIQFTTDPDNDSCKLIVETYGGGYMGRAVWVFRKGGKVFEKIANASNLGVGLKEREEAIPNDTRRAPDDTFFYRDKSNDKSNYVFQSVTDDSSYLAVEGTGENAALVIKTLVDADTSCKFNITDW